MAVIEKIMSIYYGEDKLPYKDIDRQVHYPIGNGNIFTGENNTTKFRFYVDLIGGSSYTWLATIKLPDGSLVYKVVTGADENDYVELDISNLYTEVVGGIFIGLTGYEAGEVEITYDEEEEIYEVSGNPNRLVTGVVKVIVNYSPQILNIGSSVQPSEYQEIMGAVSTKLAKTQGIPFYQNKSSITSSEVAKSELKQNQVIYDLATQSFYKYDKANDTFISIGGGGGGSGVWGQITGTLANQTDLMTKFAEYRTSANQDTIDNQKQTTANKVTSWQTTPDDTHYPSEKLVKDSLDDIEQEVGAIDTEVDGIQAKIPSQASSSNQLADKSFVNSSIATNTANFLGTLDVESDLGLTYGAGHSAIVNALNLYDFDTKTNNDYCFVINKDSNNATIYERYKYVDTSSSDTFSYEFTLNNSSFTASQWNAINSGITSGKVTTYDDYETSKQNTIDSNNKLSSDLVDDTNNTNKFVTANDISNWNAKSTVSGVNDGTNWTSITINGTTKNVGTGSSYTAEAPITIDANNKIGISTDTNSGLKINSSDQLSIDTDGYIQSKLTVNPSTTTQTLSSITIDGVNYAIGGSASGAVLYSEAQSLTTAQKSQARDNIGAISSITLQIIED